MAKFIVTIALLCIFAAVFVKGFDKSAAMAAFITKMDDCKAEVGAKDGEWWQIRWKIRFKISNLVITYIA